VFLFFLNAELHSVDNNVIKFMTVSQNDNTLQSVTLLKLLQAVLRARNYTLSVHDTLPNKPQLDHMPVSEGLYPTTQILGHINLLSEWINANSAIFFSYFMTRTS